MQLQPLQHFERSKETLISPASVFLLHGLSLYSTFDTSCLFPSIFPDRQSDHKTTNLFLLLHIWGRASAKSASNTYAPNHCIRHNVLPFVVHLRLKTPAIWHSCSDELKIPKKPMYSFQPSHHTDPLHGTASFCPSFSPAPSPIRFKTPNSQHHLLPYNSTRIQNMLVNLRNA